MWIAYRILSNRSMHGHGIRNVLVVFAHYAVLVWMTHATGLLLGGILKAMALAVFALLLLFVIGRSANLLKMVAVWFCVLPSNFAVSSSNARWVRPSQTDLVLPAEPLRALLFQRPPPLYSL